MGKHSKKRKRERKLAQQRAEAERDRYKQRQQLQQQQQSQQKCQSHVAASFDKDDFSQKSEKNHTKKTFNMENTTRLNGTHAEAENSIGRPSSDKFMNGPAFEEEGSTESKKRRRNLEFVYPKKNGVVSAYHFEEKTQEDKAASSSAEETPERQPNGIKHETIDDIFSSSRSKEHKKTISSGGFGAASQLEREITVEGKLSGLSVEEAVKDKSRLRPRANSTDGELNLPMGGLCDEFVVLQAHKWNLNGKMTRASPRGLVNLGNTCFLNSTLQCLAYLPPFCQSIISMPDHTVHENGKKTSAGKRVSMLIRNLFQKVHGGVGHGAIAPNHIVRAIPTLGTIGSRNGYKFRPGRQEDAHEFLIHLLDAMHDGELREAGINQNKSGWRDRLPVPRLDETTFVHRIFGGYLRSQVRCTKCGYCSNTYDPFLDLALEVSRKSIDNIAAAFNEFTRKETLDSENRYKCSGCKKRVCATKQLTVFRPPLTLCVQLKRFTFGGGGGGGFGFGFGFKGFGSGGGGGNKVTKPISFPAELNMPLSDKRSCPYALTGVVIHVGGSSNSGHYTAYVKKASACGSYKWYHIDDSFVEGVSEKTVLRQKDAYLLFYCRKEVKLEFPPPPRRASMTADEAAEHGRQRARARSESFNKYENDDSLVRVPAAEVDERTPAALDERKPAAVSNEEKNEKKHASRREEVSEKSSEHSGAGVSEGSSSSDDSEPEVNQNHHASTTAQSTEFSKQSIILSKDSAPDTPEIANVTLTEKAPANDDSGSESSSDDDSSSSSSSESSSDDVSDLDEAPSKKPRVEPLEEPATKVTPSPLTEKNEVKEVELVKAKTKKKPAMTRVVLDRGRGREKVSVMMGPRFKDKKKVWTPQASGTTKQGQEYELLGNRVVDKWDDDSGAAAALSETSAARAKIVNKLERKQKTEKRGQYLSSWDLSLDRGRTKKVKDKSTVEDVATAASGGSRFQRVLSSIRSVKHLARPKGYVGKGNNDDTLRSQKKRKRHNF